MSNKPLSQLVSELEDAATREILEQMVAEARADEALRCAADVCSMCADTKNWNSTEKRGVWRHEGKFGAYLACAAGPIHERLHLHTQSAKSAKPEISQKSGKTGLL